MQRVLAFVALLLASALCFRMSGFGQAQSVSPTQPAAKSAGQKPTTRRTQRVVPLKEIQVVSPDGGIKFNLLSNPERLTHSASMGDVAVIDPSPLDMRMDGYNLSS